MDPNDDNSLFNFINNLTSIPLKKDDLTEKDAKLLNRNLPCGDGPFGSNSGSFPNDFALLKKNFKALSICDQVELGSTGNSDKSLSSFGSESNDSTGDSNSGPSESILPSLIGLIAAGQANDSNGPQMRESSQSPAYFGFSSSSSSSPPLSQTSGPSSASSLSEAVSTLANGHNSALTNTPTTSDFSFNSLSNPGKSSGMSFNMSNKNENSFCTNPLDSMFSSMLTRNDINGSRADTIADSAFSALIDNATFPPAEASTFEHQQRRFPIQVPQPSGLLPTSFSQDSLPHFFQNSSSFSPFSSKMSVDTSNEFVNSGVGPLQNRKFSLFNGNSSSSSNSSNNNSNLNNATNHSITSCTTTALSSPIISTPLFTSTNFLNFNESLDQRACNLRTANVVNANTNMQARFESHIRNIANEINATVQLYVSSIEIRKDQLIKQLDHVRNTYLLMLGNKGNMNGPMPFPRINFSRPDPSHLKIATSFGFLNSPAFAPYCHVTGEGLSVAVEGEPTCFSVATRNCFNEEMLTGGENVEVDIQPIETNAHHNGAFIPVLPLIQKNVLDGNSGKYTVTYMIPRGTNLRSVKIFINVNGMPVNNSPFLATIKAERIRENWKRVSLYGEEGPEPGKFCRPWGVSLARLPLQKDINHKPIGTDSNQSIPIQSKPFYNWNCPNGNKKDYLLVMADRSNNRIQLLKLTVTESTPKENIYNSSSFVPNSNFEVSVLHIFGSGPGIRNGQFDRPAGIAINTNFGQILVVDKDNHRIQAFDMSGNFLFKFGEKGSRAGQFCYPWDIAICPQTSLLLVSDTRNRRIQLFTHSGQYLWHCGQPLDSPRGVAFLSPDRYIVSDFNKHRLLIIDRNDNSMHSALQRDDLINSKYIGFGEGSAWGEFLRPQGLVAVINKTPGAGIPKFAQILCADSRNNRIAIWNSLNQNFEYIHDENVINSEAIPEVNTNFDRPSGIAMADNILAVVDFGHNRLQIFQKYTSTAYGS